MEVIEKPQTRKKESLAPTYEVIVHNDDYNTFNHVANCLVSICKHEFEQAIQCSHIIHNNGKCSVKRGDLDVAISIKNKLQSSGLIASMENV